MLTPDQIAATNGASAQAAAVANANMGIGGVSNGALNPTTAPAVAAATAVNTAPASEPTALSSGNITDNVIPANNDALAKMQAKGTYSGQDGNTYYTDGTLAWQGQLAPGEAPPGIDNPENDPDIAQINKNLGGMKAVSDASTKQSLDSTHQMYANRVAMQQDLNQRASASRDSSLINNGTAQYAQKSAASIMTAQERAGMASVSNLEAQENAALAKVTTAQQKGDMQAMNTALKEAQQIRTQKQKAADALQKNVQTQNDAVAKQHTQALRDEQIEELFKGGTTDASDILEKLNSTEGNDFSLKEIDSALTALKPTKTTSTDIYKFDNTETGKLLSNGFTAAQIQGISDDLNGRGDGTTMKGLSNAQQSYLNQVLAPQKVAASKPTTSGSLTYSPADVSHIQSWINNTKGDDGYVDPNAYKQVFDSWTQDGGIAKDFLSKFPPKNYVNPANNWLPQYLRSKTSTSAAAPSDVTSQINSLFGNQG